ncbi:MAG: hypothetical protein Q8R91_10680 [Candidatus Omnitrophota bacterium]|nr:hypothetical protein [Candidatus Omnitrophota bacterium]
MKLLVAALVALAWLPPAWAAEDGQSPGVLRIHKPAGHVIYRDGSLLNAGDEVAARCELVEPFYRYLGDVPPGGKVSVSWIKTRFTVQYLTPAGLAKWRRVKETFYPKIEWDLPEIGLDVTCALKGLTLSVDVQSLKPITNTAIEVLPDLPVRISEERIRYVASPVAVAGQHVVFGWRGSFPLLLLQERPTYSVPVQVSFEYQGVRYEKLILYSFAREELRR